VPTMERFVLVNSGSVTPAAQRLSWTLAQAQVGDVGFYGAPEQEHLASDLPVGEASAMSRAISSYLR
jgi:hypothetical protein